MSKRNIAIIAIVAGAAVLVIIYLALSGPKSDKATEQGKAQDQQQATTTVESTVTTTTSTTATTGAKTTTGATTGTKTTSKTSGAATESYVDALKRYTDAGYRVQFIGCRAAPGKLIVKKGKSFMLDNRGDKSIKVTVGTANYFIGAYKYAIATEYTVGTNYILCNGVRAAEITVVP